MKPNKGTNPPLQQLTVNAMLTSIKLTD